MSDLKTGVLVYNYDSYRQFLKDALQESRSRDRKYSFRFLARVAGFKSHNTLWNVIDGRSNLSDQSIEKIAFALKLNREEAQHFQSLVHLNQAETSEERAKFSSEILRSKAYRKTHPLSQAQLKYYTRWYFVVVREMAGLPGFREDLDWIAANAHPKLTREQAGEAVEELLKLGLLTRDAAGKLTQANADVATNSEVTSGLVAQFHREFMKLAAESIDSVPREKRDISSVTFQVSGDTAALIKQRIQAFRKELLEIAGRDSTNRDAVYQLNLQLFPVTRIKGEDSG